MHFSKLVDGCHSNNTMKHLKNLNYKHTIQTQKLDTKYIQPALTTPLLSIQLNESNPDKDLNLAKPTIITTSQHAHIYDENGKHLATILITRLQWLWKRYWTTPHYIADKLYHQNRSLLQK